MIKKIVANIIAAIILFVIIYLSTTSNVYRLTDSLFTAGAIMIAFSFFGLITREGVFDPVTFSFSKIFRSMRKKSFLRSEHETDPNEIKKNETTVRSTFYEYKTQKSDERRKINTLYTFITGVILIIISLFI